MYNQYTTEIIRSKITRSCLYHVNAKFAQSSEVEWRGIQSVFNTLLRGFSFVLTQGPAASRYFIPLTSYHRAHQSGFVCTLNGSHCSIPSIDHAANETGAVNGTYLRGRQRDKRRGHLLVKLK